MAKWQGTAEDWNRFREYVQGRKYRGGYGSCIINYAQQYSDCLFKQDLSRIREVKDSLRPNILKALSALAKFTGQYESWKVLLKNFGVSWVGRSADDVFIDRLTSTEDPEEIWRWIVDVKKALPQLTDFLDLMAVGGLRFVEGLSCYNLTVELSRKGQLPLDRTSKEYRSGYFNRELSAFEHFWPPFRQTFIRNTKKVFVTFVPEDLVSRIGAAECLPNNDAIKKLIQKHHLPLRFSDVREAQGTFMTKYLKTPEIDFLQGRVTSSVFLANYFNPSLIVDLKDRVFRGIREISEKVRV